MAGFLGRGSTETGKYRDGEVSRRRSTETTILQDERSEIIISGNVFPTTVIRPRNTSDDERLEPTRKKQSQEQSSVDSSAPVHSRGQPSITPSHTPPTDGE